MEQLAKLRPAFRKDGTVTAGNSSGVNDGAAAIIIASEKAATEIGLTPLAQKYLTFSLLVRIPAIAVITRSRCV